MWCPTTHTPGLYYHLPLVPLFFPVYAFFFPTKIMRSFQTWVKPHLPLNSNTVPGIGKIHSKRLSNLHLRRRYSFYLLFAPPRKPPALSGSRPHPQISQFMQNILLLGVSPSNTIYSSKAKLHREPRWPCPVSLPSQRYAVCQYKLDLYANTWQFSELYLWTS